MSPSCWLSSRSSSALAKSVSQVSHLHSSSTQGVETHSEDDQSNHDPKQSSSALLFSGVDGDEPQEANAKRKDGGTDKPVVPQIRTSSKQSTRDHSEKNVDRVHCFGGLMHTSASLIQQSFQVRVCQLVGSTSLGQCRLQVIQNVLVVLLLLLLSEGIYNRLSEPPNHGDNNQLHSVLHQVSLRLLLSRCLTSCMGSNFCSSRMNRTDSLVQSVSDGRKG
mmetsp:Transcript_24735/g.28800  ORF Transcript_24735/g.28800 Transcript_24735/m.28800 type:complete len:220 (+) Transcript_24735:247-906(+)